MKLKKHQCTVKCDQCVALSINGVASHGQGCPNSKRPWVRRGYNLVPEPDIEPQTTPYHDEISEEFDLANEMRDDDYDF